MNFLAAVGPPPPPSFERVVRAYPPSFLLDKPDLADALERSDKAVLFSGWVRELSDALDTGGPIIFEVVNGGLGGGGGVPRGILPHRPPPHRARRRP